MNRLIRELESRGARGRDAAIKRDVLATWMGVSVREVKHQAEEAVEVHGVPVAWSTDAAAGGLYICETDAELEEAVGKATRLALSILRRRSALKRIRRSRMPSEAAQGELWGS